MYSQNHSVDPVGAGLDAVELRVQAVLAHEVVVRTRFDDAAVGQHHDQVTLDFWRG